MRENFSQGRLFAWQRGYSAFSVSIRSKRTPKFKIRGDVSVVSTAFQLGGGD